MIYCGLDIETTGLDLNKDHRLIQLALVYGPATWVYDVLPIGVMTIDPRAMEVNKFTLSRIEGGVPNDELDHDLSKYLLNEFKPESLTAVGWNIGSFDLPFLKKELPKTSTLFSHRVVDLSGICILAAERKSLNWRNLKEVWHKAAEEAMNEKAQWHDALWDARAALKVWELLIDGKLG